MSYRQYELESGDKRMTCWLKEAPAVKVGSRISLKHEPDTIWDVKTISQTRQDMPPERFWKVGGLH